MASYIYAIAESGFYYGTSDTRLNDPDLIEVPSKPPNGNHKWTGVEWTPMSEAEVNRGVESEPEEKIPILPETTTENAIATWGDRSGSELQNSSAIVTGNVLAVPIVNTSGYYLNGQLVTLNTFVIGTPTEGDAIVYRSGNWVVEKPKRTWCFGTAINSGSVSSSWLRRFNGVETDRSPYCIPFNAVMYSVTVESQPTESDDFTFEIYLNGQKWQTFVKPSGVGSEQYNGLNLALNEGDRLSFRAVRIGNGNISYPGGVCYFIEA